jgi:hypothetical protein
MSTPKKSAGRKKTPQKRKIDNGVGLGDAVEVVTRKTGIKKAVDIFSKATGLDCGCEERKARWNNIRILKGWSKPDCLTRDQYDRVRKAMPKKLKADGTPKFEDEIHAKEFAQAFSMVFKTRYQFWCPCDPATWKTKVDQMAAYLNTYEDEKA